MHSSIADIWAVILEALEKVGAGSPDTGPVSMAMIGTSEEGCVLLLSGGTDRAGGTGNERDAAQRRTSGGGPSVRAVVREVVEDGVPRVFRGAEAIEALLPGAGVAGVAVVPVVFEEKTLGTVNLGLREGRVDRARLKGWVEGAAKIGERLAFYRSLHPEHKRNIQLNLINRLGQQDVWKMDLPDFFDLAVVSIREGLGYYNVSLFRIEEGSRDLVLTAHAGAYRGRVSKGYRQSIERGMLGWVVRNGEKLLANDVRQDPNYVAVEGLATKSEICIPIFVEGEIEGVLNVESDLVGAFDEGDGVALEATAQQVADVIQVRRKSQAFELLKAEVENQYSFGHFLGRSEAMRRVFDLIQAVSKSDMTVLIQGETGTGKELVAKAIHEESDRKEEPFIAVNCAALPESLFESELFGHERGAFTGAHRRRAGKMEQAQGGTLFLDEVGEIPYSMQAKLLRAIEEQRFTRVGGEKEVEVDVRILSATNRSLAALEQEGGFRKDLYFRLNPMQIDLPPLRERIEDIPLLAAHFLREACVRFNKQIDTMAPPVLSGLVTYPWPGNIRELEHVIAGAVLLEGTSCLSQVDLPRSEAPKAGEGTLPDGAEEMSLREVCRAALEEIEREYLRSLLIRTRGNVSQAAKQAGITRRTLYNKLEAYGMRREDFVPSA